MPFLKELEPKVKRVASSITDNREDQKDLAQEMLLYLFKERETLEDKTEAYLLRSCYFRARHYINRGRCIDSKPRKNTYVVSLYYRYDEGQERILPIPSDSPSPQDIAIAKIMKEELESFLSKGQKEIFKLLLEGYTPAEIARMRKVTRAAISKSIKKLRKKALKYLGG